MAPTLSPTLLPPAGVPAVSWLAALHTAAAKALVALPACNGRLERAIGLVRAGAVVHAPELGAQRYLVASESDPAGVTSYDVVGSGNPTCACTDFAQHGGKSSVYACKHILAVWVYRRAQEELGKGEPPEPTPQPAACPEALFSLCLHGTIAGRQATLTIRGQDADEFMARARAMSGLLDIAPPQAASPPAASQEQGEGWCAVHGVAMQLNQGKDGRQWRSHKAADGSWCKGKAK